MSWNEQKHMLTELINQSKGKPIDIGLDSLQSFKITKTYSEIEIQEFEIKNGLQLPIAYRRFLLEIGACEIYSAEESHHVIEFHKLDEIYEFYSGCFENPKEWLFKKYLPIGSDNSLQESFGFSFYFKEPEQFFVLFHEYYLEELEGEDDPECPAYLCSFEGYIDEVIENKGELKPH